MTGIEKGDIIEFESTLGERLIGKVTKKGMFWYYVWVEEKKMEYIVLPSQVKRVCKNESSYP